MIPDDGSKILADFTTGGPVGKNREGRSTDKAKSDETDLLQVTMGGDNEVRKYSIVWAINNRQSSFFFFYGQNYIPKAVFTTEKN